MKFTKGLNIKRQINLLTLNVGKNPPRSKNLPQFWGIGKREEAVTLEEFQKNSCEGGWCIWQPLKKLKK
jgi:hypothetical protein